MTDPIEQVKKYLRNNGYPLEMFVAKQFRNNGFQVYQSNLYTDKETGKDREIDVIAYYWKVVRNVQFSFKVVIECKYAKNLWVLFCGENPDLSTLPYNSFYCANYAGKQLIDQLTSIPEYSKSPFFIDSRYCYGLIETSDKENPNANESRATFKAVNTLINYLHHEKRVDSNANSRTFEITIPVIVIQGKLFECYLNDEDDEVILEINEGQLVYKSAVFPGVYPILEIITKDNVNNLAKHIAERCEAIFKTHFEDIEHFIAHFPSDPSKMAL